MEVIQDVELGFADRVQEHRPVQHVLRILRADEGGDRTEPAALPVAARRELVEPCALLFDLPRGGVGLGTGYLGGPAGIGVGALRVPKVDPRLVRVLHLDLDLGLQADQLRLGLGQPVGQLPDPAGRVLRGRAPGVHFGVAGIGRRRWHRHTGAGRCQADRREQRDRGNAARVERATKSRHDRHLQQMRPIRGQSMG